MFALTLITEIGDIKRFPHPRKLVSWIGMDIREYSSGGKHNRFGITKHGNRYLRTAFVEANQRGYRTARIGKDLKSRRKDIAPELVSIADRCLRRLNRQPFVVGREAPQQGQSGLCSGDGGFCLGVTEQGGCVKKQERHSTSYD